MEQRNHRGQTSLNTGSRRWNIRLRPQMTVSRENEVSILMRSFQQPFGQRLPFSGTPPFLRKPSSASTMLRPLNCWISSWNSLSGVFMVSPSQSTSLSEAVENPAQLDSNAPASFLFRFLAKLLRTASFPEGKQQFSWGAVNHQEKTGISQESLVPLLVRDQQPLQPCAIRQPGKQGVVIALEPARKGAKVTSWREQTADRS